MSKKDPLFVERRNDGKYVVERSNSERVSFVSDTQKQSIHWAKDHTNGPVYVERQRHTDNGKPDQWRKP